MLLSLDLGTTHSKAGLFTRDGSLQSVARQQTVAHQEPSGSAYYDPQEMWAAVIKIICEVTKGLDTREIAAVGIASMAETGLLVDKQTGEARSHMLPWYDASAAPQVKLIQQNSDPVTRFYHSGMRPNFKCSLAKLLWLREKDPHLLEGSVWLSTADYIAFRLTGNIATDYSLAGRTYAFQLEQLSWDIEWLERFGFRADLYPQAVPSGHPIGGIRKESALLIGLPPGTPVAISGHDHVCAAFAAVGTESGLALDSMGTAEALVGSFDRDKLGMDEYQSGLVFGRHVAGGGYYWMGGMSASGGSIEWLRTILGDPTLSYQELEVLVEKAPPGPTGILYFPYLSGSGSPHTDIQARGAFVGLVQIHKRSDLVKAVLEGTAYEAEFIRQAAQKILRKEISSLKVSGGGSRLKKWVQIKADVSGCEIEVSTLSEAALLGAALVAGIGCGVYSDEKEARAFLISSAGPIYQPNGTQNRIYQQLYQEGFLPFQNPLRDISSKITSTSLTTKS